MTPLVLLPGMMCDARLFQHQIAVFSARRAVHCSPLTEHDNMPALAEAVLQQAPPRFALCGLSMGGIVAMEVQRQAPERIAGLALLDTNPLAEREEVAARRAPQMDRVRRGELLAVMRDEMKPNYLADAEGRESILDLCAQMALSLGDAVFIRQSLALRERPDQCATLRQVRTPTLLLCGEQDRLCPPERHAFMQTLVPGAELAIVADAGHLPVLEQPEVSNRHLQAWLQVCDNSLDTFHHGSRS